MMMISKFGEIINIHIICVTAWEKLPLQLGLGLGHGKQLEASFQDLQADQISTSGMFDAARMLEPASKA